MSASLTDGTTAGTIQAGSPPPQTYNSGNGALMTVDGKAIAAPSGSAQSANGLWYSNGQAYSAAPVQGGTPNYVGGGATLNANINTPVSTGTQPPPVVVTSATATKDLTSKQVQTNQLTQDAQAQAAAKAAAAAPKQTTDTGGAKTDDTPSLDKQINDIVASLATDQNAVTAKAQTQIDPLQKAQQENQIQLDQQGAYYLNQMAQISSGTYPLSAAEQAMIASTVAMYQRVIDAQTTANRSYTGQMTSTLASLGIQTSAPTQAIGLIHATIDSGTSKIADLDSKMSAAVANLTLAFQKQDYDMVSKAWDDTSKFLNDRNKTLQDMQKTITDAANQQKQDIKDRTTLALTAIMDSNTISHQEKQDILNQAQLDETKRHDFEQELVAKFTAGMTGQGSGDSSNLPTVGVGADGKPDIADQQKVYDAYVKNYGKTTADMLKGLADYSINPADWRAGSTKGMSRATAVALAKAINPSYDDSQYSIRAAYKKSLSANTGGSIGAGINAANKSINHLTSFVEDMRNVGATGSSLINIGLQSTIGQAIPGVRQNLKSAKVEGTGVADELAKFFKGTGATDVNSIETWKDQLSTHASPSDVKGLVQGAVTLLSGQLEVLSEQYQRTMGQPPPDNFLGASAKANLSTLKNQGYTVNIPGILYTDKNAYTKYDPSAEQNMHAAVDQLTATGLPLTPENILQLAQSQ